jgi:hypothetical protein
MSSSQLERRPSAGRGTGLVATRRLGVLDEWRVPYSHAESDDSRDGWASLRALEPGRALHWFFGDGGEVADGWSLGSVRIWGRVASDSSAASFADSTQGEWFREAPIVDRAGEVRSWTWRASNGATILPFDPDEAVATLRSERYLRLRGPRWISVTGSARWTYYTIRPLLPRRAQIGLRRAFSRIQARTPFPRWPVEPALHDLVDLVLERVADAAGEPVPSIAPWPRGHSWAFVLTHDVETWRGRDSIGRLRSLEGALGFRSAWNFVPERYQVPDSLVTGLKAAGCEVGVHGLRHDGRDLAAWDTARSRVPEIRRWARRWGASGFRAPATHRVWEAMPELGFLYDSSYPDTDPFEPMAGGCCSWLPFFNRDMVELPITLTQDHTLFVILGRDESLWREKLQFLRARGGMALAIVHPDYMGEDRRLDAYRRLLESVRDDPEVWTALPCEVADWWRRRASTSLRNVEGSWQPRGPAASEVAITYVPPRFPTHMPVRLGSTECV